MREFTRRIYTTSDDPIITNNKMILDLIGKTNDAPFCTHARGTVLFTEGTTHLQYKDNVLLCEYSFCVFPQMSVVDAQLKSIMHIKPYAYGNFERLRLPRVYVHRDSLFAETLNELKAFALKLGIRFEHIYNTDPGHIDHIDIRKTDWRYLAIEAGAHQMDVDEFHKYRDTR